MRGQLTRGMLSGVSLEQGELSSSAEQFRQMQVEARAQRDFDDIAHTQLGLAHSAYQWNNLEAAQQAAQEALAIGERMNVEEFQALAATRLALIEYALGQTAPAQQRLLAWLTGKPTPTTPSSYQFRREVQAVLARLQLTSGNTRAVERWFESIEQREEVLPPLQRRRKGMNRDTA